MPVVNRNKRSAGKEKEDLAASYLQKQGYRICERNFRTRFGEIDLIAEKDSALVFVEVKYRSSDAYGDPLAAVDLRKQRRICRTGLAYYAANGYREEVPCRFDVIAVYGDGRVEQVENAFEFR